MTEVLEILKTFKNDESKFKEEESLIYHRSLKKNLGAKNNHRGKKISLRKRNRKNAKN